ncbi:unnamed protein product [Spodoptera exigua]|nr:unnamed protein product [Spodoptera exigua]
MLSYVIADTVNFYYTYMIVLSTQDLGKILRSGGILKDGAATISEDANSTCALISEDQDTTATGTTPISVAPKESYRRMMRDFGQKDSPELDQSQLTAPVHEHNTYTRASPNSTIWYMST